MPCRYEEYGPERPEERPTKCDLQAMLCGIATTLHGLGIMDNVLRRVDWQECGVDRNFFESWFVAHQTADNLRRTQETIAKQEEEDRVAALAKLSPKEKRLLGIREL